ncbi:MAG: UDP-N-acetylglucosamine--N-acetylmuramyl-(pentapeptide) pyrophosphoryl-undecaprenol [Frankiaceae bacterium]|jgi:UDP-N-acetylglucosamine--N-acetylmuramyl-(pentapeptide) pyrophosphoryl-undecaprenol N-acetylglucosamine transferase|nr:UDP-N-acetylglucosamine--N-acetylmuramyl-(pentapeptide) pyrophosphoryl-undecaprenol [Frankiaceae bacterium]
MSSGPTEPVDPSSTASAQAAQAAQAAQPAQPGLSVLLAGGGTAGHVEPALAVADALVAADASTRVTLLGTASGLETRLVPARGYRLATIPRVPLPRKLTGELLRVPGRLRGAVTEAGQVIDREQVDVVVGFGGYVALPAYLAARRRKVPVVVHEANPLPGLANRIGARLTRAVAVSWPNTKLAHAELTGIPLRPAILTLDRAGERAAARAEYGLDADRPTLLVFGGSQGARRINQALLAAAAALTGAGVQVLHATGTASYDEIAAALPADLPAPYVVVPYLNQMQRAYAAADLALCRSGAMTCAELAAVGLPAAFVPLPIGNGEQRLNAAPAVEAGAALLVDDASLTASWVESTLLPVLSDPARLGAMSEGALRAAARTGHREAAQALVHMITAAAGRPGTGGAVRP